MIAVRYWLEMEDKVGAWAASKDESALLSAREVFLKWDSSKTKTARILNF